MTWGHRRQLLIFGLFAAVVIVIGSATLFAVLYKVPSCTDKKMNQDETGIDCGGSCSTVCNAAAQAPQVQFVRAIDSGTGRMDVIAYVQNLNSAASATGVQGTIELYDASHVLLTKRDVTFDLPPSASVPVYVPGVTFGDHVVTQAFLTIATSSVQWMRAVPATLPDVTDIVVTEGDRPRVTATLQNPFARQINNIRLIATAFDASGNAIAASQTVASVLPSQGSTPLVFTWNVPFASTPARVEIIPVGIFTPQSP